MAGSVRTPSGVDLVVDALAAYRITRLVIEDKITEDLRTRVHVAALREIEDPATWSKVKTLLSCPWCVGFWISVGVVGARLAAPRVWRPIATAFALSAAVGLIEENLG